MFYSFLKKAFTAIALSLDVMITSIQKPEVLMEKLKQKQDELVAKILKRKNMIKGSVSSVCIKCSRANCICELKTSGRSYRLTYKEKGLKSKIVYVPKEEIAKIEKMIKSYRESKLIIDQLIDVNIKIFKEERKKVS